MNNDWHNEDELSYFEGLESYRSMFNRKRNDLVICVPSRDKREEHINSFSLNFVKRRQEIKDRMLAMNYSQLESRTLKSFSTITGRGFESLEEQMRIIEGGIRLGKTSLFLANLKAYCSNYHEKIFEKLNIENKYFAEFEYVYRLLSSKSKLPRMKRVKLNYILKCIKAETK